jgi:phosphomevalonate kinase
MLAPCEAGQRLTNSRVLELAQVAGVSWRGEVGSGFGQATFFWRSIGDSQVYDAGREVYALEMVIIRVNCRNNLPNFEPTSW